MRIGQHCSYLRLKYLEQEKKKSRNFIQRLRKKKLALINSQASMSGKVHTCVRLCAHAGEGREDLEYPFTPSQM